MLIDRSRADGSITLTSPTAMPQASGFLWNRQMLLQINCRGFATAQHMQPEPSKYAHAPFMEARTFMQPEQPYYAHHPGRFFYIKDDLSGETWSLPYEPMRRLPESFAFTQNTHSITWAIELPGLLCKLNVSLAEDDVLELWSLDVVNTGTVERRLSIVPCFSIGYMSWMNQSARYEDEFGGVIARSITPYQKLEDYPHIRELKDITVLLHDRQPTSWETRLSAFEGEGGLHNPDALHNAQLSNSDAIYEMPVAALHYQAVLSPGEQESWRFVFGPAKNDEAISALRKRYLRNGGFEQAASSYRAYIDSGQGCMQVKTPDPAFDDMFNHWVPRQVFYHGDTNRLATDPQTRNYLQDNLGMVFVDPTTTRAAICTALSQQKPAGDMPEGVLLSEQAELKYINQVPHSDHCIWLPVCIQPYLNETGDSALLDQAVPGVEDGLELTVYERVTRALRWLADQRDERGLSRIDQGDWCDPMNMVGPKGIGVSGWLSIALVHAAKIWADISAQHGQHAIEAEMRALAEDVTRQIHTHLWDGNWFARGITDGGRAFGVASDSEGRIFLNPQSWALLAEIVTPEQQNQLLQAMADNLDTPFGMMMLAPAYTAMQDDIGRVTQKFPGSAENGAVYNHASAFLIHALYRSDQPQLGWRQLTNMLPGKDEHDLVQRGQLPVFIPNYYRGAIHQHPRTAGRSSQLFNTGTASWIYRIVVENLFGLRGCAQGLEVAPALPDSWNEATVERRFRGCVLQVHYHRDDAVRESQLTLNGEPVNGNILTDLEVGKTYQLNVTLPGAQS